MGEIADSMINGETCSFCGVYLEPGETVVQQGTTTRMKMPSDGDSMGFPVICLSCS